MRELIFIILVIAYPVVNFLVFYLYKNVSSFMLAFQDYDTNFQLHWVGLQNIKYFFKELVVPGNVYLIGLSNNLICFVITYFITYPLVFAITFFMYKKAPFSGIYRFTMMIPSIISSVLVAMMFLRFVNAFPKFMEQIGISDFPKLLSDKKTRFGMTIFYEFWNGFGMTAIYYYNAMNGIDDEIVESAQLDGINYIQEFFYITFPMIFPTLSTFLITGVSGLVGMEGPLYLFWKLDAPADTYRFGYIMFRMTMKDGTVAYPLVSAIGFLGTCVIFPLTMLLRKFLKRIDPNN